MNDAAMAIPRCGHHHFSNGQKADADSTFSCAGGCSRDVPKAAVSRCSKMRDRRRD
jgi:hypothetical protein